MKYIDTHSHLYSSHFDADQGEVIARAQAVLEAVFLPNISVETVDRMHALCDAAPDFFFPMLGLHPSDVGEDWEAQLAQLKATMAAGERRYYGIGETGMDLYWPDNRETRPWQEASLRAHIGWAKETGLPIILHTRKCTDEVIDLIQEQHDEALWGIFHCWEGSKKQARRVVELGNFMIGIGGNVTYREDVQAVVKTIPLDRIVLETDSPYLPPSPVREQKENGRRPRNESSYTRYVGETLARVFDRSEAEVAAATGENARRVFRTA